LARASKADIKACADAVAPAPRGRIHTLLPPATFISSTNCARAARTCSRSCPRW
jgi:hypothetical protein